MLACALSHVGVGKYGVGVMLMCGVGVDDVAGD
jgi:hypothetical protein